MARLSAHGKELLRIVCEREIIADPDRLISWERTTRAYHADGVVLQKYDVRFTPSPNSFGGSDFHSYGWKVFAHSRKPGNKLAIMEAHIAKVVAEIKAKGSAAKWVIV